MNCVAHAKCIRLSTYYGIPFAWQIVVLISDRRLLSNVRYMKWAQIRIGDYHERGEWKFIMVRLECYRGLFIAIIAGLSVGRSAYYISLDIVWTWVGYLAPVRRSILSMLSWARQVRPPSCIRANINFEGISWYNKLRFLLENAKFQWASQSCLRIQSCRQYAELEPNSQFKGVCDHVIASQQALGVVTHMRVSPGVRRHRGKTRICDGYNMPLRVHGEDGPGMK